MIRPVSNWQGSGDNAVESKPAKVTFSMLRRIAAAFTPYRTKVACILIAILFSAVLGLVNPLLTKHLFDDAIAKHNLRLLLIYSAVMLVVPMVSGGIGILQTYWTNQVGQSVVRDLRSRLFAHLQRMSLRFFTSARTGEIQSRLTNDLGGVQGVLANTATGIVSNSAMALGSLIAMIFLSPVLTLVALSLFPLFIKLTLRSGAIRRRVTTERQRSLALFNAITNESLSISGVLLTKGFGRESYTADRFDRENKRLAALEVEQQMVGRWLFMFFGMFMSVTPVLIYLVAGWLLIHGSTVGGFALSLGTVIAFVALQTRLFFPVSQLLNTHVEVQGALALFDRIFEYMDLPVEIDDKAQAVHLGREDVAGRLVFRNVSFGYGPASGLTGKRGEQGPPPGATLKNISFEASPGQLIAIVGPSGAGKTTMAYLVPRLYDVNAGEVEIDGRDVRDLARASLGDLVGIVTQEPYLLHASVRENLLFARPDASEEEMMAAAKMAAVHDRILELDHAYDTVVGERGFRLSGGEKQRLAIARVILQNPRILILDEATSALDSNAERLIQTALESLMQGRTTLAIAHRLSTVRSATLILVIDRGEIVERGTHRQLVEAAGLYARLYREQLSDTQFGTRQRQELLDDSV